MPLLLINCTPYLKRQCSFAFVVSPWVRSGFFPLYFFCSLKLIIFMSDHYSDPLVFCGCSNLSLANCWSLAVCSQGLSNLLVKRYLAGRSMFVQNSSFYKDSLVVSYNLKLDTDLTQNCWLVCSCSL